MSEFWLPYPGNPHYAVSTEGRVRRESTGRILRTPPIKNGYATVQLTVGEPKARTLYVHRMVWETHRGPIPPGWEVRHGPNGQRDNRLADLDVGTPKQNAADRIAHGTQARGERHGRSAANRKKIANAR
jgi:hypothetical protein